MDRAAAALRIASDLGLSHTNDRTTLYGLFPAMFPGGYEGDSDVTYYYKEATLENVVVALVRWTGWDTIHYDLHLVSEVKPFVSPLGFPYYKPDPTPRSIPYVVVALQRNLIPRDDLPKLRSPVTETQIDELCSNAKHLLSKQAITPPLILDDEGIKHIDEVRTNPQQVIIIPTGFSRYDLIRDLPNRFIDLNAPSLRLFNAQSGLSNGRQDYFPLGPLESQLSVGLRVSANSYSHQAESIYGLVENESTTVNAVGIWGAASSLRKDARVWGGFLVAQSAEAAKDDAQVIGLEIDTINNTKAGLSPNRSKVGLQVVGIGNQPVTNAIEVIGAGRAKWSTGMMFDGNSIYSDGAVIGVGNSKNVARGIDFSQVQFKDSAFLLHQGSRITFNNISGAPSMLYTDAFSNGHFVLRAGQAGLRIASNDDSKNLAIFDQNGNIITPRGNFDQLLADVNMLKKHATDRVPSTSHDGCSKGDVAEDQTYIYVCVSPNKWRRASLSDW